MFLLFTKRCRHLSIFTVTKKHFAVRIAFEPVCALADAKRTEWSPDSRDTELAEIEIVVLCAVAH